MCWLLFVSCLPVCLLLVRYRLLVCLFVFGCFTFRCLLCFVVYLFYGVFACYYYALVFCFVDLFICSMLFLRYIVSFFWERALSSSYIYIYILNILYCHTLRYVRAPLLRTRRTPTTCYCTLLHSCYVAFASSVLICVFLCLFSTFCLLDLFPSLYFIYFLLISRCFRMFCLFLYYTYFDSPPSARRRAPRARPAGVAQGVQAAVVEALGAVEGVVACGNKQINQKTSKTNTTKNKNKKNKTIGKT